MNNNETKSRVFKPFRNTQQDSSFLVAKGIFEVQTQKDLRELLLTIKNKILQDGLSPDSEEIVELKKQAQVLEQSLELEQRTAEKQHVKKLGSAIFMLMINQGHATVRAVGARASYNASKAIAIAKLKCKEKDIRILTDMSFNTGNIGDLQEKKHSQNVTAMLFEVKTVQEWEKANV